MKRYYSSILALTCLLIAAPAVTQTTERGSEDVRTNPNARSLAPPSGLTITGEVVEWNDDQIVLKTGTGTEHIQITPRTVRPDSFTIGEMVGVDFTRTSHGVMIAQQIRPEGSAAPQVVVTGSEPTETQALNEQESMEPSDTMAEEPMTDSQDAYGTPSNQRQATTDQYAQDPYDTNQYDTAALPQTASPLALVLLTGFGALAGAAALRRRRATS